MAVKKKTRKVVTSAAAQKIVDNAVASLATTADSASKALDAVSKENKKLMTEIKRLSKKRATLMRKKKAAANRVKRDPNAANKKDLKGVEKDIAANQKEASKVRARKTTVSEELASLKTVAKRATAYTKAFTTADRALNKPKKKRRKARAA